MHLAASALDVLWANNSSQMILRSIIKDLWLTTALSKVHKNPFHYKFLAHMWHYRYVPTITETECHMYLVPIIMLHVSGTYYHTSCIWYLLSCPIGTGSSSTIANVCTDSLDVRVSDPGLSISVTSICGHTTYHNVWHVSIFSYLFKKKKKKLVAFVLK